MIKKDTIYCDYCGKVLKGPEDGFVIRGMIMPVNIDEDGKIKGVLIGRLKPLKDGIKNIDDLQFKDIANIIMCRECMKKALGL